MTIASDLFRTVTIKINDISQQLTYIVVNQADDNGKIIRSDGSRAEGHWFHRRTRRLSCGRQNHLQRQTLYVFDGRLCVDS